MGTCIICRFAAELDDVAVGVITARFVCLRCYGRETSTAITMPRDLQRDVEATLADAGVPF